MSELKHMERLEQLAELIEKRDRQVNGLLCAASGLAVTQAEIHKHMKALGIQPKPQDKAEA